MSLDVYLMDHTKLSSSPESKIYIREDGETREISRVEWDKRFPGVEAITIESSDSQEVYWGNITHNLGEMAREAGIYEELWRPDEIQLSKANQLIEPLRKGLRLLMSDPDRFKEFNPENGWGDYKGLIGFVSEYIRACSDNPEADISVSR